MYRLGLPTQRFKKPCPDVVTMSDLLGRKLLSAPSTQIPDILREFAEQEHLPEADVGMLSQIQFRGEPPRTKERWQYIYTAIRTSESLDE